MAMACIAAFLASTGMTRAAGLGRTKNWGALFEGGGESADAARPFVAREPFGDGARLTIETA